MLNPSTAMVSTAAVTGLAAFFTCACLDLTLSTVRFVAFPRATLVSLRVLERAVGAFFFCTFDGCFLRLGHPLRHRRTHCSTAAEAMPALPKMDLREHPL
jgi:hypothetical protein